ncbi:MAG: DUF2299 domain-containing protein [Promethearchaeota archaeon]|nr:MAG: DUF2299 domain-containing protein [Candidatus Lokiarchaeota archaeon]
MSEESKIEHLIREYLLDEGILRERLKDPKIEFGFQFAFPPGKISKIMFVIKPKKKDLIIITIGTQISDPHINALNSLTKNKKMQFFIELRKSFLLKDVYFRINIQNYRYEISDQIFLKQDGTISKNSFFKSIRKVFNSAAYSNIILEEYCSEKIKPEDFTKTKEFTSGTDFSLYS